MFRVVAPGRACENVLFRGGNLNPRRHAFSRSRGMEYSRGKTCIRGGPTSRVVAEWSFVGGKVGPAGGRFFGFSRNGVFSREYLHPRRADFPRCRRIEFRRGKSGPRGGSLFRLLAEWSILGGIRASAGGRFSAPPRKHYVPRVKCTTFGVRVFAFSRNGVFSGENLHPRGPDFPRLRGMGFSRGKSWIRGGSRFRFFAELSFLEGKVGSWREKLDPRGVGGPGPEFRPRTVEIDVFATFWPRPAVPERSVISSDLGGAGVATGGREASVPLGNR